MKPPTTAGPAEAGRGCVLPRLLLIADGFASGRAAMTASDVQDRVAALVEAGVPWVQLRDHGADPAAFAREAERLAARLRTLRPDLVLSINRRPDVARALGAGLHAAPHDALLAEANGLWPVSVAAHRADEAAVPGVHAALVSPIFPTRSHPGEAPAGLALVREAAFLAAHADVHVLALGGVTPDRAAACRAAGAHGVAVLSALLDAPEPDRAVAAFLAALAGAPASP